MTENQDFLTFDRFQDESQALQLYKLLTDNDIRAEVTNESQTFDPTFAFGNTAGKSFNVKLHPDDFTKAETLIENLVLGDLDDVGADYYLYGFSDAELKDVLAHRDQWSAFDFMLAQKLLRERGNGVSADELQSIRDRRLEELATPEENQSGWIIAGYLFALLGGILGIVIGWHLSSFKKTLPNGQRVLAFTESNRKSGKRIFNLSILSTVLWLLFWFNKEVLLR